MGDRVRLIGGAVTPVPDPDPLGLIQDWKDKLEAIAVAADLPRTEDTSEQLQRGHQDYDGIYCNWRMSQLFATTNPTLSQNLFDNAVLMSENYWTLGLLDGWSAGPLEQPNTSSGFHNYNLGHRVLSMDPATDAAVAARAATMAHNYARGSTYAKTHDRSAYFDFWQADNTWPSSTTISPWNDDPAGAHWHERDYALSVLSHLVVDSDYSDYEARDYPYGSYTLVGTHNEYFARFIGRWFLGTVEASGYWHQCTAIQADLVAAGGDFDLVPATWTANRPVGDTQATGFSSFEFMHVARMLIYYYEDDLDNTFNTLIQQCVTDMCDWLIAYWQKDTPDGNNALIYRISYTEPHTPATGSADIAFMLMPMFAWVYSKTGESQYYDMAVDLATTGIADGYWAWRKWWNQQVLWGYDGFQWLGWTEDEFSVFWK